MPCCPAGPTFSLATLMLGGVLVAVVIAHLVTSFSFRQACEVSVWKSPIYLIGLTTAYAELGAFELAVKWLEKAIELSPKQQQAFMKGRLEQFRQHKPIRGTWR